MEYLYLMTLNTMRNGLGTMHEQWRDLDSMIDPMTGQGILKGEERTFRTFKTEMHLQ